MPSDLLVGRAVTVRDAAEADLDAITAIWNHEVLWTDATTDTEPRNARTQREWFERHPASYPIVVAARGDQVLAFGALSPYRPKPAFAWTVEDSVYVERSHRGAGLGSLILRGADPARPRPRPPLGAGADHVGERRVHRPPRAPRVQGRRRRAPGRPEARPLARRHGHATPALSRPWV